MIDWDDIVDALSLAATFDDRNVSELDVKAWLTVAEQQGWSSITAVSRVIFEHYGSGADKRRITPAAITDRLREIGTKAADSFEAPIIPDDLSGADYPAWYRERLAEHKAAAVEAWAATGVEPGPAPIAPPGNRLDEILAQAPDHVRAAMAESMRAIEGRRA